MDDSEWLELGRIRAPFGIKGWVHVESYTDPLDRLIQYREWRIEAPRAEAAMFAVVEAKVQGKGLVARLEGIADRNAAGALQGSRISVARKLLPPLREREYYRADLIGLRVVNLAGHELGVLHHFVDLPGGATMVIGGGGKAEHWVPATPQHLRNVDLNAALVVVDWPVEAE